LVMLTAATIAGVAFVLHLASRFGAPVRSRSAQPWRPASPPASGARGMFGGAGFRFGVVFAGLENLLSLGDRRRVALERRARQGR
jgi:hypothetical protein